MRPVRHGCQEGSANLGTTKACGMPSSAVGIRRGWRARSQRDVDHGLDVAWSEVEIAAGFVQAGRHGGGRVSRDVLFEPEQALDGLVLQRSARAVSRRRRLPSMASSTCSAITGPTLPRSSRICLYLLAARVEETPGRRRGRRRIPSGEVGRPRGSRKRRSDTHLDLRRALAVSVDAAVALLQAVGVPGDLVVDEAVAGR